MAQAASLLDQRENRYYWLRLKEDFFEDDRVRIIESSPDGEKILLFYLKLMLKSIKGEGEVLKGTGIVCTPQTLGAITGTAPEVVQQALELLQSLGMIELQGGQEHREGPPQPQQVKEKQFFRAGRYIRVTM